MIDPKATVGIPFAFLIFLGALAALGLRIKAWRRANKAYPVKRAILFVVLAVLGSVAVQRVLVWTVDPIKIYPDRFERADFVLPFEKIIGFSGGSRTLSAITAGGVHPLASEDRYDVEKVRAALEKAFEAAGIEFKEL